MSLIDFAGYNGIELSRDNVAQVKRNTYITVEKVKISTKRDPVNAISYNEKVNHRRSGEQMNI